MKRQWLAGLAVASLVAACDNSAGPKSAVSASFSMPGGMVVGDVGFAEATIVAAEGTDVSRTIAYWRSSNPSVATISSGLSDRYAQIDALAAGITTIIMTVDNREYQQTLMVIAR